jgi:hypothetical protein
MLHSDVPDLLHPKQEVGCVPDALMLTRCMVADHARSFALRHVHNYRSRSRFSPRASGLHQRCVSVRRHLSSWRVSDEFGTGFFAASIDGDNFRSCGA